MATQASHYSQEKKICIRGMPLPITFSVKQQEKTSGRSSGSSIQWRLEGSNFKFFFYHREVSAFPRLEADNTDHLGKKLGINMPQFHRLRCSSLWRSKSLQFLLVILLVTFHRGGAGEDDPYKILGVSRSATVKEIKSAYRRKALDTHPDKRKDISAEEAAAEFQKVVAAFEILSDADARRRYDRTGSTKSATQQQQRQQNQRNYHGFQFTWSYSGGNRQRRKPRLKDQFKVKEAMSRVMHISSLTQLRTIMLDDNDLLEKNLLMCFVTPGKVEEISEDDMVFPWPFAAMSAQGIWWEDLMQTVKIKFNRVNDLTRFFDIPDGNTLRQNEKPIFVFARRGTNLSDEATAHNLPRLETKDREVFDAWVWKMLEVHVTFVNEHPHPVELYWIHGTRAEKKATIQPGERSGHTTMLSHEWWVRDARVDTRSDSPGRHKLTKESGLANFKIITDEPERLLRIEAKTCFDLSGHCTFYKSRGECKRNPVFMRDVCRLSCKICDPKDDEKPKADQQEGANHDEL